MPLSQQAEPRTIQGYASPFDQSDVDALMPHLAEVLRSGKLALGQHVGSLEREFGTLVGADQAIALSSGTTALITALRAMSETTWLNGGEVLVPAHTFFAVPAAVILAGGKVRLVDISLDAIAPSLAQLAEARTENTVGAVLVHMGGVVPTEIAEMAAWLGSQGLWLVEDASHAHGSRVGGRHAGTFGTAGVFSMFATKVLTCGEGGLLVTDRPDVAERSRLMSNLGRRDGWGHIHELVAGNGRLSEVNALLGRQMVRNAEAVFAHRRALARSYDEVFLPAAASHGVEIVKPRHECGYYKYVVLLPDGVSRDELRARLRARGVNLAGEIYTTTLDEQPALASFLCGSGDHPTSRAFSARHVCVPLHRAMSADDCRYAGRELLAAVAALRSAQ
jgi:dTDP-4-amino-4,6-dideoxygalactose transaminase